MEKPSILGKNNQYPFQITRDKDTKVAWLHVAEPCKWSVYAETKKMISNSFTSILSGDASGVFLLPIDTTYHYSFNVKTDHNIYPLSETVLPMTGAYNFRDLGGYKNKDGKTVKWGTLFRSDDLGKLTVSDLNYLDSIPLISVVDFRSLDIVEIDPDKRPASVRNNYSCSINPGTIVSELVSGGKINAVGESNRVMEKIYASLVTDQACISSYRKFFALLQDVTNIPLVFHCSAGKDRTGMAAALILYSLGVDEETIFADYLFSNYCLEDKYSKIKTSNPSLIAVFEVQPMYLQIAIDKIKELHGTVDNYLTQILNVDTSMMKSQYLLDE